MSARLHRVIATIDGPVTVAINRRGCAGEWTPEDEHYLAELVRAVVEQYGAKAPPPPPEVTR